MKFLSGKHNVRLVCASLVLSALFSSGCLVMRGSVNTTTRVSTTGTQDLVHIVLFKFREGASAAEIAQVERAFRNLPHQIQEVQDFSWGVEMSGRNLSKGFTHGGMFTFDNEADRDAYLAHPSHVAFAALARPVVEELFVFDYWAQE